MEFTENKSALIFEADDNGEITVNVATADIDSLPGKICAAMAKKLIQDAKFQADLMPILEEGE